MKLRAMKYLFRQWSQGEPSPEITRAAMAQSGSYMEPGCSYACRPFRHRGQNGQGSGSAMHACLLSGLLESVACPEALMSHVQGMNRLLHSYTRLCKVQLLGNL